MAGIYQRIWTADQENNGIEAIRQGETGSQERGWVKVNTNLDQNDPDLQVLTDVHIPDHKKQTYELCRKLFNNFTLAEPMEEIDTEEEREEVHNFMSAIIDTPPMEVAREYIARETGRSVSRERWYNTVFEMWFRRFSKGGDPHLSGFEHVIVGEHDDEKVQGYHFWWKYFLDDGMAHLVDDGATVIRRLRDDRIDYLASRQADGQARFPESVTISYRWTAPDYDTMTAQTRRKPIGGFFVGCSVEGLMAMGTVRAHQGAQAPKVAVVEGARYDMKLFHSENRQHIRTFYPIFKGESDIVDGGGRDSNVPGDGQPDVPPPTPDNPVVSPVRIIAARVNPFGHDPGFETVTLVNTGTQTQNLAGWSLRDKNNNELVFDELELETGEFRTITLDGFDIQLSNKGGEIRLHNAIGTRLHRVTYSKAQAKTQGITLLF